MHRKDSVVAARFCEGGHRCLPPKECCAQGCCYLYAPPSAPRTPTPATDHVLNLFLFNHWYFWCFVLAIVLALLCACSLWKKRRQLCGWGSPGHHSQSEGDSAGSCYAPPQYSRCNSFHIHAPPPYTEVTSKPDLYPLVFSYTGDTGKNGNGGGANYLMVQYFRNYIVRPVGSLSGTSTVDSLSSSFICTANEANTLIPPPYSRAASPDLSMTTRNYLGMPRSASQQACTLEGMASGHRPNSVPNSNYYGVVGGFMGSHGLMLRSSESAQFNNNNSNQGASSGEARSAGDASEQSGSSAPMSGSQSDHYRFSVHNSTNNNNSVASDGSNPLGLIYAQHHAASTLQSSRNASLEGSIDAVEQQAPSEHSNTINNNSGSGNAANLSTRNSLTNANIYSSCGSIGGISITIPANSESEYQDLNALRRSLETCCQILQQQQKQAQFHAHQQPSSGFTANSEDSPINIELAKKFEGLRNSYIGSNTGSNVSSLANLGTPDSPPRATSPTLEVRELLEQIRQLQNISASNSTSEGIIIINPQLPPTGAGAGASSNSINNNSSNPSSAATAPPTTSHLRRPSSLISKKKFFSKVPSQGSALGALGSSGGRKAMYIPIASNQNSTGPSTTGLHRSLRSPSAMASAAAVGLLGRGRNRCSSWMSKSAPTTPGTGLPPGSGGGGSGAGAAIGDHSPLLLNEQDEDGEQNV